MPESPNQSKGDISALFGKQKQMTGGTDQKVKGGFIFVLALIFAVPPLLWVGAINDRFDTASVSQKARRTAYAQGTIVWVATKKPAWYSDILKPASTQTPTPSPIPYMSATLQPTQTPYPTQQPTQTEQPTLTPSPTQIISFANGHQIYGLYYFMFSRYWPPLLGANCHPDNVENGTCKDTTASGEKWSSWQFDKAPSPYKGGVAVPLSYPLWVTVRVTWPPSMAGDYLAVDYCPACDDYPGVTFIDFISENQLLEYWTPIKAEVLPTQ